MSAFEKLDASFGANWTTLLVGWKGLGVFSPWPDRWIEFPPLVSPSEIATYAGKRLETTNDATEQNLISRLLSPDLGAQSREAIKETLKSLSDLEFRNPTVELRKWRIILLEELLNNMPQDPIYAVMSLTEFWQSFGFPADSPHEVQGRQNNLTPTQYYQNENLSRLICLNWSWARGEREVLEKANTLREV